MAASKLFDTKDISEKYAKFRPVYPKTVAQIITSYMKSNGSLCFQTAVDIACGSGQSTFLLCDSFQEVIGVDISKTQIEQAKIKAAEHPSTKTNVQFIVGDAHHLPIESSSIDLVTCATAWHWLDPDLFYAEAQRVLKPRGCLVVYSCGFRIINNDRMKTAFDSFIDELFCSNCFSKQNLHVLNEYKSVTLPFLETKRIEFDFPQTSSIEQLLGLMSSISMYNSYCEKFPENNLLHRIKVDYEADARKVETEEFSFPGFVILGIKA